MTLDEVIFDTHDPIEDEMRASEVYTRALHELQEQKALLAAEIKNTSFVTDPSKLQDLVSQHNRVYWRVESLRKEPIK